VKQSLKEWIEKWKHRFSTDLNKKAKRGLEGLMDELKQIQLKIDKPAQSIDSLGSVMSALEEIRRKQSSFSIEIRPITEMYDLLTAQFGEFLNQDEHEAKDALDKKWAYLRSRADNVRDEMHDQKARFKNVLYEKVKSLIIEVDEFRDGFEQNGPLEAGLQPDEALERLKAKTEEYQVIKTKYDELYAGEILFGLPNHQYPKLTKTEEEIALLDKLYGLYQKFQNTIAQWYETSWEDVKVVGKIDEMIDAADNFQKESLRLPGQLKQWLTYGKLKNEI
jgi:dynein heavy chain